MQKILMFGKNGLISYRIHQLMGEKIIALGKDEVDFNYNDQIITALEKYKPDLIINAAAYTDVDQAEDEEGKASQINGYAVGILAQWAEKNKAFLIHFSTDYVFDGLQETGYKPTDAPSPINAYGRSKWLGECEIKKYNIESAIFRISWIYDQKRGRNFFRTMKNLMSKKSEVFVVNDQWGSPTEASWVAEKIVDFINQDKKQTGIFHLSQEGMITWYDFADLIKKQFNYSVNIRPVSSGLYQSKARRPKYSKLIS